MRRRSEQTTWLLWLVSEFASAYTSIEVSATVALIAALPRQASARIFREGFLCRKFMHKSAVFPHFQSQTRLFVFLSVFNCLLITVRDNPMGSQDGAGAGHDQGAVSGIFVFHPEYGRIG